MRKYELLRGSKASQRPEIQERSLELIKTLPKYKEKAYMKLKTKNCASHWAISKGTEFELFPLYWDEHNSEHVILKDSTMISLPPDGFPVVLEGGIHWWNHVLAIWEAEWRKTPEYAQMISESMKAIRESDLED